MTRPSIPLLEVSQAHLSVYLFFLYLAIFEFIVTFVEFIIVVSTTKQQGKLPHQFSIFRFLDADHGNSRLFDGNDHLFTVKKQGLPGLKKWDEFILSIKLEN